MTVSTSSPSAAAAPWTCPFCPLLCDGFSARADAAGQHLALSGSDCQRAHTALARFSAAPAAGTATAFVNGVPVSTDVALAAAAEVLAVSRQPVFGGLGTDVAGARALYRLACETGAISDAASGPALMHGLRALQDRGAFTTTLAEVRARADVIVCLTGSPAIRQPEFFRRCGVGEAQAGAGGAAMAPLARHVVVVGGAVASGGAARAATSGDGPSPADASVPRAAGITTESMPLHVDLFTTISLLAALVENRAVRNPPPALVALAARLKAAHYAVIVWEGAALPAHGALVVEAINAVVGTLNRSTRAASFPLGGADGAATVNQVFAWLGGLPLRSRLGPRGLEHEPLCFDTRRLLADGAVDALLWVASYGTEAEPPSATVPRIVLGHPSRAGALGKSPASAELAAPSPASPAPQPADSSRADSIFIPVSTPGIGSPGHVFRTDGVVLMPLHAVRDDGLPTVAEVAARLFVAVQRAKAPR